jgi:AMMECR1 domain-containing protein
LHADAIVPMMVGIMSPDEIAEIALIVEQCVCKKSLIIISADIGNYHHIVHDCLADSSPVCVLYDQDAPIIQAIQSPQESPVGNVFDHRPELAIFGIFCHLIRLPEFKNIQSLFVGYATSCHNEDSFENLATYAAFMVQDGSMGYKNLLGHYEQSQLLQHARNGLYELFNEPDLRLPFMISYEMMQPCGLFASLYRMSDHGPLLQGCMGKVQAKQPLYKMAYQMAQQAACKDVRFYPLRHKDLESTIISVSVICDLVKIKDYDEICPSDGLMLKYDDKKAICLPDLRPKIDWSYESALIDVSRQLGNHHFIWKKPRAKIFKFRSIVFQEE